MNRKILLAGVAGLLVGFMAGAYSMFEYSNAHAFRLYGMGTKWMAHQWAFDLDRDLWLLEQEKLGQMNLPDHLASRIRSDIQIIDQWLELADLSEDQRAKLIRLLEKAERHASVWETEDTRGREAAAARERVLAHLRG